MDTINQIYFSPTGTTKKIIHTISSNLDIDQENKNNITYKDLHLTFSSSDLVIIGSPVYSGRIPDTVLQRIEHITGNNTPAIVTVVYGNREYDDALLELSNLMTDKGFKVISAAAFIGEHSFSCKDYPIAENRPDKNDLKQAADYGARLSHFLRNSLQDDLKLNIPGNYPYKEKKPGVPLSPVTNDKCTMCFSCIEACPTNAIKTNNPLITNSELCIKCCACIKACNYGARSFENEGILNITKRLFDNCKERREPELLIPIQ
jgi:ferredoxin/flavodoxin